MTELQVNAHFWVLCGWIPLVQGHVSINPFIRQIYSLRQKHAFVVVCLVTQGYQKGFGGKSGSMEFSLELEESITWAGHHVTVQFHSTWARTGEGTIGVGTAITTRTVATLINIWKGKHELSHRNYSPQYHFFSWARLIPALCYLPSPLPPLPSILASSGE